MEGDHGTPLTVSTAIEGDHGTPLTVSTAMEGDHGTPLTMPKRSRNAAADPDQSPWLLPSEVEQEILCFLPISALIVCKAVCPHWHKLIKSPNFRTSYQKHSSRIDQDILFVRFPNHRQFDQVAAYHTYCDRWIHLAIPAGITWVFVTGGSLILAEIDGRYVVADLFLRSPTTELPSMKPIDESYPIAIIEETDTDYMIVAVSTTDRVRSQVYDSRTGQWELRGELDYMFAGLFSAVYLNGLIYCLSGFPEYLLTFDPRGGEWQITDVEMPPDIARSRLLLFGTRLYMVAGVKEFDIITRVIIWEMDWSGNEWREISTMPDDYFDELSAGEMYHFQVVGRAGKICFSHVRSGLIILYDLRLGRWWCPNTRDIPKDDCVWLALEPYINLLKIT